MTPSRRATSVRDESASDAARPTAGQRLLRNLHLLRVLVTATLEEGGLPSDHGITFVQMSLLRLLATRQGAPTTLGVVARKLQVSVPAASKAIARLVASGHVTSKEDRDDARRMHIDVTASGENAIRRYEAARARRADAILENADAATAARWVRSLEELVGALLEVGKRDDVPCLQCGLQSPPTCAAEQNGSRCPVRALEERALKRLRRGIS